MPRKKTTYLLVHASVTPNTGNESPALLLEFDSEYAKQLLNRVDIFRSLEDNGLSSMAYYENQGVWVDLNSLDYNIPGVVDMDPEGDRDYCVRVDPTTTAGEHVIKQSRERTDHGGAALKADGNRAKVYASPISPGYVYYSANLGDRHLETEALRPAWLLEQATATGDKSDA